MPEKWYPSPTRAHDLIRRLLPEMWSKVTIIKRALHPAQLTSDLSEMSRSRTQETQRSFLTGVAFLKTEIGGYYVQRISLSFKDWRFSWLWPHLCCFDFFSRTPPWNDQMTSASTSRSILGFTQVRGHKGVSMGSGPSSQGDLATSKISGFVFSGGNWSVLVSCLRVWLVHNHHLETWHPWGLLRPVVTLRKCSKSNAILLPGVCVLLGTGPFFITYRAIFFFFFTWNDFFWPHTPLR